MDIQNDDGKWEEMKLINPYTSETKEINPKDNNTEETPKPPLMREIIHTIAYGDTLEGISLMYDVPINSIKTRNKIQSDTIYYLKTIIVPFPRQQVKFEQQQDKLIKIQQFLTFTCPDEKDKKTAIFYLQGKEWDVEEAVKHYRHIKIQQFLCYMSPMEKDKKTAIFYLQANDWNVDVGVKDYKEDLEWEKKNAMQFTTKGNNLYSNKIQIRKGRKLKNQ